MEINGKVYPLWEKFIERKKEYIGGKLNATDMGITMKTIVEDIVLKPNGEDSAYFEVIGKDFSCGFDVQYGGIGASSKEGFIGFHSIYCGAFEIENVKK